jgi:hypothetical protein
VTSSTPRGYGEKLSLTKSRTTPTRKERLSQASLQQLCITAPANFEPNLSEPIEKTNCLERRERCAPAIRRLSSANRGAYCSAMRQATATKRCATLGLMRNAAKKFSSRSGKFALPSASSALTLQPASCTIA